MNALEVFAGPTALRHLRTHGLRPPPQAARKGWCSIRSTAISSANGCRVVAPHPAWVATLPDARLPDRSDFLRYGDDYAARVAAWRRAIAESERLRDEFAALVTDGKPIAAQPL